MQYHFWENDYQINIVSPSFETKKWPIYEAQYKHLHHKYWAYTDKNYLGNAANRKGSIRSPQSRPNNMPRVVSQLS